MVVRFPSADEGHESAPTGDDQLAPVTPLRRVAASREAASGVEAVGESAPVARPVVELPSAARWNNTWGDEGEASRRGGRSARGAATRSAATRSVGVPGVETPGADPDETDEEAERQTQKVTAVTIRQLARRGMSRWELEQVLLKREIEPEVFGPELDRLEAMGVIDDASLAVTLAFTQHSRKGLGRTAIEQELKRRHIDPVLIETALADIADEDELERATELAIKRIGQLSSYDDETVRRRLHGFLARKGYGSSVVRQAMDAAFATRRRGGVRFQ